MNTCYDLEFLDLVGNIKLSETKQEIKHKHVRTSVWLDLKNTWSSGGWLCSAAQSLILAQLGRMGIFADEFVVVMNSGIPCPNDWSNFLWASLKEGKPHVDPSSNFLLWLQCEKEKDLSSKRSSFLWHSRSQNISPTFFHLSQGIERGQIHERCPGSISRWNLWWGKDPEMRNYKTDFSHWCILQHLSQETNVS